MSPAITYDTTPNNTNNQCIKFVVSNFRVSEKFIALIAAYALSRIVHHLLRPLSQPYITSDIAIGLILTSLPRVRDSFTTPFKLAVENAVDFGMICYAFVLGLEMDPYVIFKPPTRHTMVAYAGMFCTFIMASTVTPWLNYLKNTSVVSSTLSLSICLSGNGSHILTRLMTKLKVGKSDIGKLSISAGVHSDMITMLLLAIGFAFFPAENIMNISDEINIIKMGVALVIQTIVAANVSPIFINWINNENPEGKPLKGSHLVLSMAFMASICSWAPWCGYNSVLSAFMGGLFLPSEGRISKWAISKLNNLLSILFYPVFFFWVGLRLDISRFEAGIVGTWVRLLCLLVIATIGKVGGTLLCGLTLGYHRPEMVAAGLLLTTKGHFHVYLAVDALRRGRIDVTTCTLMIILVFLSVVHTPIVVKHIIERARKRVPIQRMALQWLDPSSELRILLGLHGPHNLDSAISLMEISRGRSDPGLFVHVTDMIELTEQIAAAMAPGEGVDNITVTDTSITEMRDQVSHAFQTYINENGGSGIKMSRVLALSTFNSMPQDICALAEDLMVSLILLPFHKRLNENGTLDEDHPGFRYVNRKLLRNAPCSIGILVDRGFCFTSKFSRLSAPKVAVLFIGGKDDREALAFAGRVARHPGVKLTVIRFLVDKNSEHAPRRVNNRVSAADQEEEMKLDDECFAQFYERHVAGREVAYMEKHLANSSETYTNLTSLEGQYSLIIVGRGGRVNTVLTQGLNDWQQCPELGPVGDVLSGSSSASGTSILIIQQHNIKGQLDGLSEEFSIM
ncbi:Cation/H(+) antiporter 28 [Hibiscus syriacus]|uniref:Cation/H(+) antiporter 28 n=1 Tax=Hibiscus syriacus TaxID=106335 RepID=A0A6A2YBL0_HIBSY|nr:cation/H(+) antiporter 28-like [Hibiscus syriacus]KAE8672179.1 Cation/H(+) antiporter 28 [Hibiscus syriacus]